MLVTGDSVGYVRLHDIRAFDATACEMNADRRETFTAAFFKSLDGWRAHKQSLVRCAKRTNCVLHATPVDSVDYLTPHKMVLTASTDCKVLLWTQEGALVGMFGQNMP